MKRPKKKKYRDFFEEMEELLTPEQIQRAKARAQSEIFAIRLAQLRERQGLNQTDVKGFTQSAISKLEGRLDMKLSTLLEYLAAIGMKVEILVQSKSKNDKPIPLLKS